MYYMLFARKQEKKSLAWYVETNSQGDTQEREITHAHPEERMLNITSKSGRINWLFRCLKKLQSEKFW